jgi:hypothetical protein
MHSKIRRRGGINGCADRYSQRLGRHSKKQVNKRRITLADVIRVERPAKSGFAQER